MHLSTNGHLGLLLTLATSLPTTRQDRREPTRITWFSERPFWSPDGRTLAFISKSYGDAMAYNLATGHVSVMTHYPHFGYLRAQNLPNADLFLIGAREFEDYVATREEDMKMWLLPAGSRTPVALGHKMSEGMAISVDANRVSCANSHAQHLEWMVEEESIVWEADIRYNASGSPSPELARSLPRDFRRGDQEIMCSCYRITEESYVSDVQGIDVASGEMVVYRNVSNEYNEVEGMYPGGEYTTVESAHEAEDTDDNYAIEGYRTKLEPNSEEFVGLTWMSDIPGNKAGNPVISPDGSQMTFSFGKAEDDPPGAGYNIFLLDLERM